MKRIIIGAIILSFLFVMGKTNANAVPINILSQTYHIDGGDWACVANCELYGLCTDSCFYNITSNTSPISFSHNTGWATASGGLSSATELESYTSIFQTALGPGHSAAQIDFSVSDISNIYMWVSLEGLTAFAYSGIILTDLTTDNQLLNLRSHMSGSTLSNEYTLAFDPAHTYRLFSYSEAMGDGSSARTYIRVPEPSTLLLFGAGLVGIGLFRKRRRNRL